MASRKDSNRCLERRLARLQPNNVTMGARRHTLPNHPTPPDRPPAKRSRAHHRPKRPHTPKSTTCLKSAVLMRLLADLTPAGMRCFKVSSDAFGMLSPNTVSEVSSIPNRQSQDDVIPKPFPLDGEGLEIMYVPPDLVCFGCTDARDRASGYGIRA